jgi:hypothetical protein
LNVDGAIVESNFLTDVGTGIGVSGNAITVANNRISGFTIVGIGTGDTGGRPQSGIVIVGNSIQFSAVNEVTRIGILLDGGGGRGANAILVAKNHITLSGHPTNSAYGIMSPAARSVKISGNIVEIIRQGNGILVFGSPEGVDADLTNNLINLAGEIGPSYGIVAFPNGASHRLTVFSSSNRVLGMTVTNHSFAYDFNSNAGGLLRNVQIGDYTADGLVRSAGRYFAHGELSKSRIDLP